MTHKLLKRVAQVLVFYYIISNTAVGVRYQGKFLQKMRHVRITTTGHD